MIKVGITGQSGFIGYHLYQYLKTKKDIILIDFEDTFFENELQIKSFVKQCDTIVHLAAMNRHPDPQIIYNTNIQLVKKLISTCEQENARPHILFSSSTQESLENLYGKSKKNGSKLFREWAVRNSAKFTNLIIPNVFGPFGKPFYNSFVPTFCHQLLNNEEPKVIQDNSVELIYVGELASHFYNQIINTSTEDNIRLKPTKSQKVSLVLQKLKQYKKSYFGNGMIPDLNDDFDKYLFLTFVSYINFSTFFPVKLSSHKDNRGAFTEILKLNSGGQISFSTTKPGITRGNHYHIQKFERFAVASGKAKIEFRRIGDDKKYEFILDSSIAPSYVDMPVFYTHNIANIGDDELITVFWINEHFDKNNPDTYFEIV